MKSFRINYHIGVNRHKIPDDLLANTEHLISQETEKNQKHKFRWGVVIPVCALVVACSVTAVAYSVTYGFSKPFYQPHINSSVPSAVMQKAGSQVQKTAEKNGLTITVKNTMGDNEILYISLSVKSKNGTPLQESSEFRKSILPQEEFKESNLKIGGQDYKCWMFRTDDASVADEASYECQVFGDFAKQSGAKAVLTLSDLTDTVDTCEDAGFLFNNLGELYKTMTPENPENFIKTGLFGVYADKSLIAPSWTIPAGKQHVKFSNQFPNSYIDNIGFHKTGEYGCQINALYISITPGNQKEAAALKKLCFQNVNTMEPRFFEDYAITGNGVEQVGFSSQEAYEKAVLADKDRKLAMNGGRIVLCLDRMRGKTSDRECTLADLNDYRIMKNYDSQKVVRCAGNWEIPFTLKFTDTARSFNLNKTIQANGHTVKIQNITISDLSFSITAKKLSKEEEQKGDLSPNNIKLVMKDGTVIPVGYKIGGGTEADGSIRYDGNLATLVDADKVVAVDLWGNRIALSK